MSLPTCAAYSRESGAAARTPTGTPRTRAMATTEDADPNQLGVGSPICAQPTPRVLGHPCVTRYVPMVS